MVRGPFAANPRNVSTKGNRIEVTGYIDGGSTISSSLVSDAIPSDGYGDIVLNVEPGPSTALLFALGLLGLSSGRIAT